MMIAAIAFILVLCFAGVMLATWLLTKSREIDAEAAAAEKDKADFTEFALAYLDPEADEDCVPDEAVPAKQNVWVAPHTDPNDKKIKWALKTEEHGEPVSLHVTQADAEKAGRQLALANKSELIVLGRNGEVRKKNSYA